MNITQEHLKALAQRSFEDGWNATRQGCNAEHHSLSSEALAQMRDDAVAERLEELRKELEPKTWTIVRFSESDKTAPGTIVVDGVARMEDAENAARALHALRRGRYHVCDSAVMRSLRVSGRVSI